MLQRGNSGNGCDLASTLCTYDLSKDDLFVLSWARVLLVRRRCISSKLLMCGGVVRSILSLPLVARHYSRCLEIIKICIDNNDCRKDNNDCRKDNNDVRKYASVQLILNTAINMLRTYI